MGPIGAVHQIEFQVRGPDIAAHGPIPSGIHHQALQGAIGGDPQVHAAMADLHRTGQQQASRHGPAQQRGGQEGEVVAAAGVANRRAGADSHQADASTCRCCAHQPICHTEAIARGTVCSRFSRG